MNGKNIYETDINSGLLPKELAAATSKALIKRFNL